jgi:small subunit ribosomal protein S20
MVFIHVTGVRFSVGLLKFKTMANHKSAIKRIRQSETKRLLNKYQHKTVRNAVRALRALTDKKEATALFPKVAGMLDKLTKRNIIHKNKSSNLKSKLSKHVNALA